MKRPAMLVARLALAAAFAGGACGERAAGRASGEQAVLERQNRGLGELIRSARRGSLLRFDQVLVVVDERLVQELLASATPYEREVAGKYRVRIDSAVVRFDDGFALVRLDGRAALEGEAVEERASAELSVFGGLEVVGLDPGSGVLRGRVKVIAVEARRAAVLGVSAPVERLVEDLGREKLEAFADLASALEIPVKVSLDITLPAVGPEGGVRIDPLTLPVHASVQEVAAFRGRLLIAVGVAAGARP